MKRLLNNEIGIALPIIMIIFSITITLGFSIIFLISSQDKTTKLYVDDEKALYYAEAGYNQYLWHLNDNVNFYSTDASDIMQNTPIKFEDGYYLLKVSKPNDLERYVTIRSTGWAASSPDIKRTIEVKIRKKQFVHQVYVSNNEGDNIWWTSGDEVHGPYHTNGTLRIQKRPVFYDLVTYTGDYVKGTNYNPEYKMSKAEKTEKLEFPPTNSSLKYWAELDGTVFYGRTCINLEDNKVRIRKSNGEIDIIGIPPNKVIYIDGNEGSDKWGLDTANLFISGRLRGELTIAVKNNIYITYSDPTNWYDEHPYFSDIYIYNKEPNPNLPMVIPQDSGIFYSNTTFGDPDNPSVWDKDLGIYVREAKGNDMLGLVANQNIFILHYGWPRDPSDGNGAYWNKAWKWNSMQNRWEGKGTSSWNGWSWHEIDVAPKDITIHGAIFAVNGGFGYESYDTGSRKGYITLWGNITQNIRNPVGVVDGSGYLKKYAHDRRMFYDYPPHILEPVNTGWEIRDWKEIN